MTLTMVDSQLKASVEVSPAYLTKVSKTCALPESRTELEEPEYGAIQVLRNADGGGECQIFQEKALRRFRVQRY